MKNLLELGLFDNFGSEFFIFTEESFPTQNEESTLYQLKMDFNDLCLNDKWQDALEIINQMLELDSHLVFLIKKAYIHAKMKSFEQCLSSLKEIIELDASNKEAFDLLDRIKPYVNAINLLDQKPIDKIDEYKVLSKIGQGGMGEVFKVYDSKLERIVALKLVINEDKHASRFLNEIKTTSLLHHPYIVTLYSSGIYEGKPYFTMEYIEGITLTTYLNATFKGKHFLEVFIKICEAIHYAHQLNILHRDVKPENIIITPDNIPKVMDFGLAKKFNSETPFSKTGDILGTPIYMAPEQINGEVDIKSDLYSLGIILYQALTKKIPFIEGNHYEILLAKTQKNPIHPQKMDRKIPNDLAAICVKCIEKESHYRYENVALLVDDLKNFITNKPISLKHSLWSSTKKFIARNRLLATVTCFIISFLTIGFAFSYTQWKKAEKATKHVQEQEKQKALDLAKISLQKSLDYYEEENFSYSGLWAGKGLEFIKNYNHFTDIKSSLKDLIRLSLIRQNLLLKLKARYKTELIKSIAYNHSGREIITFNQDTPLTKTLRSWDGETGRHLKTTVSEFSSSFIAFSPDGKLFTASGKKLYLWDSKNLSLIKTFGEHEQNITAIAFSPGGKLFTASGKKFYLWDSKNLSLIKTFGQHEKNITAIAFSPDGKIFTASEKKLYLWDSKNLSLIKTFGEHEKNITAIAFSSDEELISASEKKLYVWNCKNFSLAKVHKYEKNIKGLSYNTQKDSLLVLLENEIKFRPERKLSHLEVDNIPRFVKYSRDKKILACAVYGGKIYIYRLPSYKKVAVLNKHQHHVKSLAFSPDNKTLASVSFDKTIRLWDLENFNLIMTFVHNDLLLDVQYHPYKKMLATSSGNEIVFWDLEKQKKIFSLDNKSPAWRLSFSPDGKKIAVGSSDKMVRVYNIENKKLIVTLPHDEHINDVVFLKDMLLSSAWGKAVKVWDSQDFHLLSTIPAESINQIVFRDDCLDIATPSRKGHIQILNMTQKEVIKEYPHDTEVFSLDYNSHTGDIASAAYDKTLRVWSTSFVKESLALKSSNSRSFDMEKERFFVNHGEKIEVWDIEDKRKVYSLSGHKGLVLSILYNPLTKTLISSSMDSSVIFWDVQTKKILKTIKGESKWGIKCVLTHNNKKLLIADNRTLLIWNFETKELSKGRITSDRQIESMSVHPNNKLLALGTKGNMVKLWDLEKQKLISNLPRHPSSVWAVAFSYTGKILASGSDNLILYDIENEKVILKAETSIIDSLIMIGEKHIVTGHRDGNIKIWDLDLKRVIVSFRHSQNLITGLYQKNNVLVSLDVDGLIKFWDISALKKISEKILSTSWFSRKKKRANRTHSFTFRYDITDQNIEYGLTKNPKQITEELFDLGINEHFKIIKLSKFYLFKNDLTVNLSSSHLD